MELKGIEHFEIARPWRNISQEWPRAIMAQCVPQIGADQCGGACLIPIWGPYLSAEASAQGIEHFEIARPWPNISQGWPHAIMAQCVPEIGSDHCGGACLIPISSPDPSAEASAQGINHFEIARPWPNIWQEWPHAIEAQCVTLIESDQCGGACLICVEYHSQDVTAFWATLSSLLNPS
jgi:hypothetical protein